MKESSVSFPSVQSLGLHIPTTSFHRKGAIMVVNVISVLLLSVVFFYPSSLSAGNTAADLKRTATTEIGAKIVFNGEKFKDIGIKLVLISRRDKPSASPELLDGIDRLHDLVDGISIALRSTGTMVIMVPHIEERYRIFWAQAVAEELDRTSNGVKIVIPEIEYYMKDSRYEVLLLTIGDLRGILKETQQTLADGKENLTTLSHDQKIP